MLKFTGNKEYMNFEGSWLYLMAFLFDVLFKHIARLEKLFCDSKCYSDESKEKTFSKG